MHQEVSSSLEVPAMSILSLFHDAIDTIKLARTVLTLYRENVSLRALAASQEDRADQAEVMITLTEAGTMAVEGERKIALLEKQLEEARKDLSLAKADAESAHWTSMGENRRRREAEAERDEARSRLRKHMATSQAKSEINGHVALDAGGGE